MAKPRVKQRNYESMQNQRVKEISEIKVTKPSLINTEKAKNILPFSVNQAKILKTEQSAKQITNFNESNGTITMGKISRAERQIDPKTSQLLLNSPSRTCQVRE